MKRVEQEHWDGCFIACVATLLGKTYWEAYDLIHPRAGRLEYPYRNGLTPEESLKKLQTWVSLRPSKVRRIRDLRRDALLLIRWNVPPYTLMHAVVFDAKKRAILDPGSEISRARYENLLDSVLYVKVKNEKDQAIRSRNNRAASQQKRRTGFLQETY